MGSDSRPEGKFRFFVAKRPVAPAWIRAKLADMQKCLERSAWTHAGWRSFTRATIATVLFAVGCATVLAGPADPKGKTKVQLDPSRELYVDIAPAVTDAFAWTEFINDRFYGQVERAFRQGRYKGKMAHVLVTGDPPAGAQVLTIRIYKWRQNFNETVEATIRGHYDSGDGVKHEISVATGLSTKAVASVDGFSVEDAFFESARIAARQFYNRIAPPKAPKDGT